MQAWRKCFFILVSAIVIAAGAIAPASAQNSRPTSRPHSRLLNTIVRPLETPTFQDIDFLSDDNLCGTTSAGKFKCVDWNLSEVGVPDTVLGFSKTSDVIASEIGICGYDSNGLKCIQEDRSQVKLRELAQDSIRGSLVARGKNACGISATNGALRCLVPEWGSYSRKSFRILPRTKITAVAVSSGKICWADAGLINCATDDQNGQPTTMKFENADLIVTSPFVCARNASVAKCWTSAGEITLAPEFQSAKSWFSDDYATMGAITNDGRFISVDVNTGAINTSGTLHVPAPFEQAGSGLTDVWASDYMHFCALAAPSATGTCWVGYSGGATTPIKFSEPVLGFIPGRSTPCALLQSGQIECADEYSSRVRSLPTAGESHVKLRLNRACVWNEKAIDCGGNDNFGKVEKISNVETDLAMANLCAIVNRPGSTKSEVACRATSKLDQVPQATEGATSLSVAARSACAISPVGLTCWGADYAGEARPTSFLDPIRVQLNDDMACALDSFGLVCWGDLDSHAMRVPSGLNSAGAIKDFALGSNRACGLLANGTIQCWGTKLVDDEEPPALTGVTALYGSRQHVFCATNASGLHCWGGDTAFPR